MEIGISLAALILSIVAIVFQRESLKDEAYNRFSQLWFDMDQVFIDHPQMHKYFYRNRDGAYAAIEASHPDYELAVCIAERFCDAFQYTDPMEKYLRAGDRQSYKRYREMICASPVLAQSHYIDNKTDKYYWNR